MQAGLRLCCSQTPEDRFSRVVTHFIYVAVIAIINVAAVAEVKKASVVLMFDPLSTRLGFMKENKKQKTKTIFKI